MKKGKSFNEVVFDNYLERKSYVDPILSSHSINLLYAPTGVGKTFISLLLACTLTSERPFLNWNTQHEPKVLYVDGEMGYQALRDRLVKITDGLDATIEPGRLDFLSFEEYTEGSPNLADPTNFEYFEKYFEPYDIIVVDNLDTTTAQVDRYDSDMTMWARMRPWLLKQRSEGKCFFFVHHSNKAGEMYGSSKIGNTLDLGLSISKPEGTCKQDGINEFKIEFFKSRFLTGKDTQSLWISMMDTDSGIIFNSEPYDDYLATKIQKLSDLKDWEIADILGITKQKVLELKYRQDFNILEETDDTYGHLSVIKA